MSVKKSLDLRGSKRLAARRQRNRVIGAVAFVLILVALLGGALYGASRSGVRISTISVSTGDAGITALAESALAGSYFGIIPRDSIFFFPKHAIRAAILAAHPELAAVSISRTGWSSIAIMLDERTAVARWCGATYAPPAEGVTPYCYLFDGNGFIYVAASSTDATLNNFALYAPLAGSSTAPLNATIAVSNQIPAAFDFARRAGDFGSPVAAVVVRGDEVDDILASGTRLTYVLGDEENAYAALASARASLDLASGATDYVDLRFDGKIYVKKK